MIRRGRAAASILASAVALATPAAACAAAAPADLISAGAPGGGGNAAVDACDVSIQCLDFAASADGSRTFFSTTERLAPSDLDAMTDVYERAGGVTTQVSTGLPGGNGNFGATLQAISADGSRAVFGTYEPLTRDDLDLTSDVYERSSEVRLVSTGAASSNLQLDVCEPGSATAIACYGLATGAAGTPVYFTTPESLTFDDLDVGCFAAPARCADVYRRSGEQTTLVSTGTAGQEGATLLAVSRDGSHAFFTTKAALTSADTDSARDIYERASGTVRLVSAGSVAGAPGADVVEDIRVSDDGSRAVFATPERLVAADTDAAVDLYERAAGVTTLLSGSNSPSDVCNRYDRCAAVEIAADGSHVAFETPDSLVPGDGDGAVDVYEHSGGETKLVSDSGAAPALLDGISADGARVFFSTRDRIVPADTDSAIDVYERFEDNAELVSTGTQNGNGPQDATFEDASRGGTRVVFSTAEALDPADTDNAIDLYVRAGGETMLVSRGSADERAFYLDMADTGKKVFYGTAERLAAADTDAAIDVYAADLSGLSAPDEPPSPPSGGGGGDEGGGGGDGSGGGGSGGGGAPQGSPPASAGTASGTPARGVLAAAFGKRLTASRAGVVLVKVRCGGAGVCGGRIVIAVRRSTIGRKTFTLAKGSTGTVKVKLSRKARRLLARRKPLKATIVVQTLDGAGALASSSLRAVTIKRR